MPHGGTRIPSSAPSSRVTAAAAAAASRAAARKHASFVEHEECEEGDGGGDGDSDDKTTAAAASSGAGTGVQPGRGRRQCPPHHVAHVLADRGALRRRRERERVAAENAKLHARIRATHGETHAALLIRETWGQLVAPNVAHANEEDARRRAAIRLVRELDRGLRPGSVYAASPTEPVTTTRMQTRYRAARPASATGGCSSYGQTLRGSGGGGSYGQTGGVGGGGSGSGGAGCYAALGCYELHSKRGEGYVLFEEGGVPLHAKNKARAAAMASSAGGWTSHSNEHLLYISHRCTVCP